MAALETKVIACDPYVGDARFAALGVERIGLEDLAARADYVSVHTLLNAETHHLIGESFFRRMKPTALLVNTSRGPVVDEGALIRALQEGRLAGAALDVFEQEPMAADNPPAHGQCHRHAACRLLLLARRRPDPRAAARRSRACSPMRGPCTWSTRRFTPPAITAEARARGGRAPLARSTSAL